MIGQTISHYRITEKIGEGGMGVVYKALDTTLDRPVALKFLATHLVHDQESRVRFLQEAKAAAALDHPNVCMVHEIAEVDGRTFIVMPFLDGRPLSAKIAEGPLKLTEALSIAIQIAEGLEAAHAKSIVHRDIKPDNIMLLLESRGLAKIMDFGLAHLTGASRLTQRGTTLGTVAYTSPEQTSGGVTDHRADIWSLGVVLHEMIAGRPPFAGETSQAQQYAILNQPAEPLTALRTGVPKELERIVAKCLAKKPEHRFQHVSDLLVDLQALRRQLDEPDAAAPRRRPSALLGAAVAATVLVALGAGWWLARSTTPRVDAPPHYNLRQLTRDSGYTGEPAISPNGQLVAYTSDRSGSKGVDIWVQQTSGGNPIQLTNDPADDYRPAFSPDSSRIAFWSDRDGGGIFTIPALGGAAKRLAAIGHSTLAFSPDGRSICYSIVSVQSGSELFARINVVPVSGGTPRIIETDLAYATHPIWSPDGKYLLAIGSKSPGGFGVGQPLDWWIIPSGGGKSTQLSANKFFEKAELNSGLERVPRPSSWLAEGNRVLFSASFRDSTQNLWQVRLASNPWRMAGEPQRLTSGTGEASPSFAANGRIAFTNMAIDVDIRSLPLNPNTGRPAGPLESVITGMGRESYPSVSKDGRRLIYISTRSGNADVWLRDVAKGEDLQITASAEPELRAAVSPDGSKVAFTRVEQRKVNLYLGDVAGRSERRALEAIGNVMDWLPDGKTLLYYSAVPIRWKTLDTETGKSSDVGIEHPEYPIHDLRFSPDQRWVAFKLFKEPTRMGPMFVARADGSKIATESDWIPIEPLWAGRNWWSPDGRLLYFLSGRDGFWCIWTQKLSSEKKPLGKPEALLHLHGQQRALNPNVQGYGLAPDRLYLPIGEAKSNVWLADPM